nr:DNA repair protein UVH3 [Ipomoea batatas]
MVNAVEVVNAFLEEVKGSVHKFREWIDSPDPIILGKIYSRPEAPGDVAGEVHCLPPPSSSPAACSAPPPPHSLTAGRLDKLQARHRLRAPPPHSLTEERYSSSSNSGLIFLSSDLESGNFHF